MLKITVFIEGGCCLGVATEDEGQPVEYELEIVDYDNIDEDDGVCEMCGRICDYDTDLCLCNECLEEESVKEDKDVKKWPYGPEYR